MMTNWTKSVREQLRTSLPAEQALPDKQPAYVDSLIYYFGSLTMGFLGMIIFSGIILAVFGPHWWHVNGFGHFINSLHFWSVQGFFFFMVLHLWGKFFMGSWRDGRGRTWVTGGIIFAISIIAAFTGYLSQTNFDSQWIAVSAKDAMNSVGIGGFFNVLNFGQMYSFHIFLLPIVVLGLIALHLVLVRLKGVVRPYAAKDEVIPTFTNKTTQEEYYAGIPKKNFDVLKELTILAVVALVVTVGLAAAFSTPDEKALTIQSVARDDSLGFTTVALAELDGSSVIANYGQPYNTASGATQSAGPVSLQQAGGVSLPLDTAQAFVVGPLSTLKDATVVDALKTFNAASADDQAKWTDAYNKALQKADGSLDDNGYLKIASDPSYGPVQTMLNNLLDVARTGALDGYLLTVDGKFYETDFTKPLLFLNEGALPAHASDLHLAGNQWGMMNSVGRYPGQAWLWLYTFWYQVPAGPFNGPNADIAVMLMMFILTSVLIFLPYIPGLNQLPKVLGVYRLIWRDHYAALKSPTTVK